MFVRFYFFLFLFFKSMLRVIFVIFVISYMMTRITISFYTWSRQLSGVQSKTGRYNHIFQYSMSQSQSQSQSLQLSSFSSSTTTPTTVKVSTYNILSSHLAAPDWFRSCKPEDLNATNRLVRLKSYLNEETEKSTIICLQEVSMTWAGELHTYFSQRNYHFIVSLYGNKFNNYMGVGIAIPMKEYDIIQTNIKRISDSINIKSYKTEKVEKPSEFKKVIIAIKDLLFSFFIKEESVKTKLDPWYESMDRKNHMVTVTLKPKKSTKEFTVGTYHMPCMFTLPSLMMIHSTLSTQFIQSIASGRPYIFCGDFNITPKSSMYQLLTQGNIDENNPDKPPTIPGLPDSWKLQVQPMISAYANKLGKEPDYTNHAKVKDEDAFIDTLDYIFLSSNRSWKVDMVRTLPSLQAGLKLGPLPINTEPSDHLPLSAVLTLL